MGEYSTEDDGHHSEAVGGWDYYSTVYKVADKFYEGVIRIENRDNGREFKDITKIREINRNAGQTAEAAADADNLSINNIPQNAEKSNTKKSLDVDSEGTKLSDEQIKRYKNVAPELRDEQGRIKPFYHGTSKADVVMRSGEVAHPI